MQQHWLAFGVEQVSDTVLITTPVRGVNFHMVQIVPCESTTEEVSCLNLNGNTLGFCPEI